MVPWNILYNTTKQWLLPKYGSFRFSVIIYCAPPKRQALFWVLGVQWLGSQKSFFLLCSRKTSCHHGAHIWVCMEVNISGKEEVSAKALMQEYAYNVWRKTKAWVKEEKLPAEEKPRGGEGRVRRWWKSIGIMRATVWVLDFTGSHWGVWRKSGALYSYFVKGSVQWDNDYKETGNQIVIVIRWGALGRKWRDGRYHLLWVYFEDRIIRFGDQLDK